MDTAFRQGRIEIDFPVTPFGSPLRLLSDSVRVFFANFGFLARITLLIYLPGHLLFQFGSYALDAPANGVLPAVLLEVLDVLLAALAAPAVVYGLVQTMRGDSPAGALRWGIQKWPAMLANEVKVEITVLLYGAMLIVPGIVAMIRLAFVPIIVAIEGNRGDSPLKRSRLLAQGRFWRMLCVFLPLTVLDLGFTFLLLDRFTGVEGARLLFAVAESLLALAGQLATVAALLMYLGIAAPQRKIAKL